MRFLLQKQVVGGVLMAGYDSKSVNETSAQLITLSETHSLEEQTRDYASRYVLTPVLIGMQNIPAKIKRLAVVGTPCQIQAVKLGGG